MSRRMRRMEARVKMWVLVSSTPGGPLTCVELGILEILEILEILGILGIIEIIEIIEIIGILGILRISRILGIFIISTG